MNFFSSRQNLGRLFFKDKKKTSSTKTSTCVTDEIKSGTKKDYCGAFL